jgi:hypothetical protein
VQCLGAPEWARLTFTRYGVGGAYEDATHVLDGPRWVHGTTIDLQATLPWLPEYTKSLYVELRGRDLQGYVVGLGRPLVI